METASRHITDNSHDQETLKQIRQMLEGGVGTNMRVTVTHDSSWKTFPERKVWLSIENEEWQDENGAGGVTNYTMLWSTYRKMLAMPNNYS